MQLHNHIFLKILHNVSKRSHSFRIPIYQQLLEVNKLSPPSKMVILMPRITQAKQILRRSFKNGGSTIKSMDIPKGYLAVYVGELEKKRFVVPVWLLRQPTFQELLDQAEEEFGYIHPMGGLTIPCTEYTFTDLASRLGAL